MSDDLTTWLVQIGLGEHAAKFALQGIDWDVLGDLSEGDLKELGLTLGDRKRLAKGLAALTESCTRSLERAKERGDAPAPPASGTVEAERRQLTVMFIDLIDSTALAERFDPEDMRRLLGIYHQVCASAIEAHEGHIALYIGDGLLVYFGYPSAHEDDAVRAVLSALATISALHEANDRIEVEHGVRLQVRIGIETGLVVAGAIGAGSTRDHQAIVGEAANVAARLQSLAPPDAIVVGPATKRLIEGSFLLEDLGWQELKGVSGPVRVQRVLAQTDAVDRFEIRAVHGVTPLIGRAAELDMVRQRWKQSVDGEMRCVLLIGEPGIGKSRVLRAFGDSISEDTHAVVSLHCSAYYHNSPFWPVLRWLQRAFGLGPYAPDASDLERLEAEFARLGVDVDETLLVLTTLLGIPAGARHPAIDASSPSFKRRTLDVLVAIIEKSTRVQPVLVVVEDAHWIDPSSLEFVRLVLERLVAAPLLVLLTARPEFEPGWTYPHLVQVNLDRLSRRDCIAMIERLTDGKRLPRLILDQIVSKTDGVPLFVEELTKTVLQGDLLQDAGISYELKGAPQTIAIPDTLQGSLLSQLDRLEPTVKETAQIAATVGREFGRRLLGLIASRSENELQETLDSLITAEIIVPASGTPAEGDAYLFRHALIQEIAYQSLLLARRRQYHALIATALEDHFPEVAERQPELIAQNFTAADLPDRAIGYWQRAGERALSGAAYEEAIAHTQRGLELMNRCSYSDQDRAAHLVPLLLTRGGAELRLGRREAIATYRQAAHIAREQALPSFLVQAALGFDTAETFLEGSGKASLSLLEEALALIGTDESVERCRLLSRLVRTAHMTGARGQADELVLEAVALARRLNDLPSLFDALVCDMMHIGARPLPADKFAERESALQELRQIAEALGDAHTIGHACARCLAGYLEIGDVERFESALERYRQIAASGQHFVDKWCVTGAQAMRAILVGDFAVAEHKARESLQMAQTVDATLASGVYGMQMFTIRREQGRLAEVAPLFKRFVDEHSEDSTWRPGLMLICSDLGFEAQARDSLDRLAESESSIPVDSKRLVTLTYLAEVAARLRDVEHANRVYALLLPFRDQVVTVPVFTLCCGSAARYLGMLANALGDWSAAEEHFEYALRMDERLRAWPWLAHGRHEFALMLSARNRVEDRARAQDLLATAAAAAKELKMFALVERIGGAQASTGLRN
ncbi:adenylate/guanylate cyclase domain-containing protein [Paraburkholderia sp. BL10I2N1]|uniref:AAA family ATPase n=1 Tax=Paraburkholderia sp. BL10I2N1 TaxID=1938796 RepID=UPI00106102D2|nr:adenylate/guanylate cyclase domain-containing protein [Paraburkholderia sp. BL10I2N1]TDN58980.1 putative ATPase [Paraburkholderia sp. BL10I2N1]TDN67326.1 putative ATPase [Paraburkholderia sp. BL10I2N1]